MNRFDNKVVLVTGGLGAMGLAIGRRLTREGAQVILADLEQPSEDKLALAFVGMKRPEVTVLDVTSASSWSDAMARVQRTYGRLDVLVNNAGVISPAAHAIDEIELAEWKRVFSVNVDGVLLGTQVGMRVMKAQADGGAIVNMGSVSAYVGSRDLGSYGTSKAAVRALTKQAAISAARLGYPVRVNAVHPGYVWTPFVEDKLVRQFGGLEAARDAVRKMNPMNQIVEVDDVAAAVAFLASSDARMMTGADLVIDGGRLVQ